MKKVSILIILITITITLTTIDKDELKDFILLLFVFAISYLFGFYLFGKIINYYRKKRIEKELNQIFSDDFFSRVKREITILKLKNAVKKIPSSELCTVQSNKFSERNKRF